MLILPVNFIYLLTLLLIFETVIFLEIFENDEMIQVQVLFDETITITIIIIIIDEMT
jgi:hypothetical protein